MDGQLGFDLPLEEGVVKFLIVDVNLSHLGTNFLPHFGFHGFGVLLQDTVNVCVSFSRFILSWQKKKK